MKHNLNLDLYSSNLQFPVVESIARDIYFQLINCPEALKKATEIKEEKYLTVGYTIEDILWDMAYYNAETIRLNVSQIVNIELRRK